MERVFIIAELGINHGGKVELAEEMIRAAHRAGADAVKLQSFRATGLAHPREAADQVALFSSVELSPADHHHLKQVADELGIELLSTPFDVEMVGMLEELGVGRYKIASGDLTNHPLIRACAQTGKHLIISTGMGTLKEARRAGEVAREAGASRVTLLHCVSLYPTPPGEARLRRITRLAELGFEVGYSDHTIGIHACLAAVALGARVLEKHFCLDKERQQGPDIALSADPGELSALVRAVRELEEMLSAEPEQVSQAEQEVARIARRSLYFARDLPAGHELREEDLIPLRPAGGISPDRIGEVVGRQLIRPVKAGDRVSWEDLSG